MSDELLMEVKVTQPERIDHFISLQKIAVSRSQAVQWIAAGLVFLNQKSVTKASVKVKAGDSLRIIRQPDAPRTLTPLNLNLEILFEDEHLLAINKPAGLVVHPAPGHIQDTLVNALLAHTSKLSVGSNKQRPGIVHRLDKGTSGVILIAKTDQAHVALTQQFTSHEIEKTYLALAYGKFSQKSGRIENLIGRSLYNRKKFAVVKKSGKLAISKYQVLLEDKNLSLVEVKILTGRTHQIRVHLTHLGHSLVGDLLYGDNQKKQKHIEEFQNIQFEYPFLHAHQIFLKHPITQKKMKLKAKIPVDRYDLLKKVFDKLPKGLK